MHKPDVKSLTNARECNKIIDSLINKIIVSLILIITEAPMGEGEFSATPNSSGLGLHSLGSLEPRKMIN